MQTHDLTGMIEFPCDVERLDNGNTLIADAGDESGAGSEIVEVDPLGNIVWRFADRLIFAHSAKRLGNGNTLITDTTNNRLIEVDRAGKIVLDSDRWSGGSGRLSDGSHLHYPNDAHLLDDGRFIITDRNNNRFVICDRDGRLSRSCAGLLKHPHNADMLANGDVLVADSDGNRVVQINGGDEVVWSADAASVGGLSWPRDADRLPDGHTLVADSKNRRVIELDGDGQRVWQYQTRHFCNVYDADRLADGNVLFSDQQHHAVVEVDRAGNVVWMFRNYRRLRPLVRELVNGRFEQVAADGLPAGWTLATRLSEGGGKLIVGESLGRRAVGLDFDRDGALCLQQTVAVEPGRTYRVRSNVRAEGIEGIGFVQFAFVDELGGLIDDVIRCPKGQPMMDSSEWMLDEFAATAPAEATAADLRLFLAGRGRLWVQSVELS